MKVAHGTPVEKHWSRVLIYENNFILYTGVFQPFSSRETFQTKMRVWQNLDSQNSANLKIFTEPSEE